MIVCVYVDFCQKKICIINYVEADIFVNLQYVDYNITVFEAFACNCIVVTTSINYVPDSKLFANRCVKVASYALVDISNALVNAAYIERNDNSDMAVCGYIRDNYS